MADFRSRAKPVNDFRSRAIVPAGFQITEPALNVGQEYLDPSKGLDPEAALQGAGEALTLNYLPEAQAAVAAGLDENLDYPQALEQMRAREKELVRQSPGSFLGGAVGGSLALPTPTKFLKSGSALVRALKAASEGGATGFVMNPGETEDQLGDRLKNAAFGGIVGGGASTLLSGIQSIPGKLAKLRENLALRTAGAMKSQVKEVMKKGTAPEIEAFMQENKMLRPGTNAEDVLEKTRAIKNQSGEELGNIYDTLQAESAQGIAPRTKPSAVNLADEALNEAKTALKGKSGGQQAITALDNELENLRALGPDSSLKDLMDYRMSLDDAINYNKTYQESPVLQKTLKNLRNKIQNEIDAHSTEIVKTIGGKYEGMLENLKDLKKQYGTANKVENISANRVSSDRAKSIIMNAGVGGGLGAAYSATHGGNTGEGALLGTLGMMGARKFGPGLLYQGARLAQPLARFAGKLPPRAITNPWLLMREQDGY